MSLYEYFDELDPVSKVRYKEKLSVLNIAECPYRLPEGVWENNPTKWPDVEWGDVYAYLVETPGVFSRESMKNYKSTESHQNYRQGWVHTVYFYQPPDSSHVLLKAEVKRSMRLSEEPHHPWVAITRDGTVAFAHCDCQAGLGESCSHVGSLLFKIEANVRLGHTRTTCTDEPCKWNQDYVKKVEPQPISNVKFYKETSVQRSKLKARRRIKPVHPASQMEENQLLSALKTSGAQPVVFSCFDGYSEPFHWKKRPKADPKLPVSLRSWYNNQNSQLTDAELISKCEEVVRKIKISAEQQVYLYTITKGQSDCLAWFEQREGRITSNTAHSVMHTNVSNPAKSLLKTICFPDKKELRVPAVMWGKQHEKDALRDYEQTMKTMVPQHVNWSREKAGLLIDTDLPFIGASADAVATCDCHGKRVVEVKCPYSFRDKTVQEFLADPNCYIQSNVLKNNHKYYTQVQMQMYIHDVQQCDFVVWSPKFTLIVYVPRDNAFCEQLITKCIDFYRKCVLPELLTRRLESTANEQKKQKLAKENEPPKLFCVCQEPEDPNRKMIGCDEPNCKFQWFHFECVKLKREPKGSWFCGSCRRK